MKIAWRGDKTLKGTIIFVTSKVLFPVLSGYQTRIIELLASFRYMGCRTVLIGRTSGGIRGWLKTRILVDKLITIDAKRFGGGSPAAYDCSPYRKHIKKAVKRFNPQAVIAECLWMAPCLDFVEKDIVKVVDNLDVMHVRKDIFGEKNKKVWVSCTREEEASLMSKADAVLAISKEDCKTFKQILPGKKVIYVPYAHIPKISFAGKNNLESIILFIGDENQGNIDGINIFLKNTWPSIKKSCPDAKLRICGHVARHVSDGHEDVIKVGFVRDIKNEYRNAKVVINPVMSGTGLRIKVVEALGYGKAVVTGSSGTSGLEEGVGRAFLVQDDPEKFAQEVIKILNDDDYRISLEKNALEFAKDKFSRENVFKEFLDIILK